MRPRQMVSGRDGMAGGWYGVAMRLSNCLIPALAIALSACRAEAPSPANGSAAAQSLSTLPLRISTTTGTQTLIVELAATEAEQERGLMHRPPLPPGRGMLFPFRLPRMASFWMKDTPAPLDLLFMRPDGTVAAILPGKPNDLTPISAGEPVSAVIEIAAGEAARLGLAAGDRIQWGACDRRRTAPGAPLNGQAFCPAG